MLDEADVVEAVSRDLLKKGYALTRKASADHRDVNIVARHLESGKKIFISAAGIAPSKAGRGKFEAEYTESQLFRCVTRNIHSAFRMHRGNKFVAGDRMALAFPDVQGFRKYLAVEKPVLDSLGIKIFLVTEEKEVVEF